MRSSIAPCWLLGVLCPLTFRANETTAKLIKINLLFFHRKTLTETTEGTFQSSKILSPLANARENKQQLLHAVVVLISCGRFVRAAWNHVSLSQIARLKSALLDHLSEGNDRRINHFEMKCVTERPPGLRAASEEAVGCSEL